MASTTSQPLSRRQRSTLDARARADRPHAATWLVFPLLVSAVAGVTWKLLGTDLPRPAAAGMPLLASVIVILALERVFPLHRPWNRRPDSTDLVLLVVNRLVDAVLFAALIAFVAAYGEMLGLGTLWPTTWPVPLQVIVGLLIGETLRYGMHRYSHRPGLWWLVHRTHHQPERMYALNGPRLHPLNYLWVAAAHAVPLLLLGASLPVALIVVNVTGAFVIFQHANLRLRFDGLNRYFATPDVHRLHHARGAAGRAVNYAIVLLVLDRIFGTYAPATPEDVDVDAIGARDP